VVILILHLKESRYCLSPSISIHRTAGEAVNEKKIIKMYHNLHVAYKRLPGKDLYTYNLRSEAIFSRISFEGR